MPEPIALVDALSTTRAIRRYTDDPIPDADLNRIMWLATRAPSGSNRQGFRFVVLRDGPNAAPARALIREGAQQTWGNKRVKDHYDTGSGARDDSAKARMARTMEHFVEHMHEAPVLIFACSLTGNGDITSGSSIYPAVQNLMLAARALGLGTALTTVHRGRQKEVRELLGIPDSVETAALIPLGWPKGKFGSGMRRPVKEVTYWESWGSKRG